MVIRALALAFVFVLFGGTLANASDLYTDNLYARNVRGKSVPVPTSSSTIIGFGDSITYGAYGPTSCVSAQNQPSSVAAASLTGTCWLDQIGSHYGAHVINLGVGGTLLISGSGSGISRYNAPYTCPSQSTSPTSGLPQNCKPGTIPAIDSLVGANTFVYFAYSGVNEASTFPNVSDYPTFQSDVATIINDLIAHGQPANQIVFVGALRGNTAYGSITGGNFNSYAYQYLPYTAALAMQSIALGGSFVDMWNPIATTSNPGSYFYDSIHLNDSGSSLAATTIESVVGNQANTYAGAYAVLGALYAYNGAPQFDSNGDLAIPFGSSFNAENMTYGPTGVKYSSSFLLAPDNTNTILRGNGSTGSVYIQDKTPTNIAHFDSSGITIDNGCLIVGSSNFCSSTASSPGISTIYQDGTQLTSSPHFESKRAFTISSGATTTVTFGLPYNSNPACTVTSHNDSTTYPLNIKNNTTTTNAVFFNGNPGSVTADMICVGQ